MSAAHIPTDETRAQVEAYARVGVPQKMIATLIGLGSDNTLKRHYADELARGEAMAVAEVANTLYTRATSGNDLAAAIFFLKARAGWSEKQRVEVSGPDGGPLESVTRIELVDLSGDGTGSAAT